MAGAVVPVFGAVVPVAEGSVSPVSLPSTTTAREISCSVMKRCTASAAPLNISAVFTLASFVSAIVNSIFAPSPIKPFALAAEMNSSITVR